jgi:ABC-type transporter Mla subunit MlaD
VLGTSFDHGTAVVRLQLSRSIAPLRSNTTARIRLQGVIGAKYIELVPSKTGAELRSGSSLPASRTSTSVSVFDVLSQFDARRRADLRATLGGLGEGLLGRGAQLGDALGQAPALVADFRSVADAVNARPGAAARFLPGAESLSAAIDPVRTALADGFAPEARALQPFVDERASVERLLTRASRALATVRSGLAGTDPLLSQTQSLSNELVQLTGPAPAALTAATTLLHDARAPLRNARTLLAALRATTPPTLRLLNAAAPLAAPSTKALANSVPGLTQLNRYSCDVTGWATAWYRLFELGGPPATSAGQSGFIRVAFVPNDVIATPNKPGSIFQRYYSPPCTASFDKAP